MMSVSRLLSCEPPLGFNVLDLLPTKPISDKPRKRSKAQKETWEAGRASLTPLDEVEEMLDILNELHSSHYLDIYKVKAMSPIERDVFFNYLKYLLRPEAIAKIDSTSVERLLFTTHDYLGLTRRRDETLKKVVSVALKVIYKKFVKSRGINKSLNPKKYMKRREINRVIFQHFFNREPSQFNMKGGKLSEHDALFFVKEGVTEAWFEAIIGLKHREVCWKFFETLVQTLASQEVFTLYKQKIHSMLKKIFSINKRIKFEEGTDEELGVWNIILRKFTMRSKKPKIALSILQFREAVSIALATLKKLASKFNYTGDVFRDIQE